MGLILNPRGASGAGKSEFVRRIMGWYGAPEPVHRPGRVPPMLYRFAHPLGGRTLVVLGHYERTSGGCDTITLRDGGLGAVFHLATLYAASGDDVLIEGLSLSQEHVRSAVLAEAQTLHVLRLTTPVATCIRNAVGRRRANTLVRPRIAETVAQQDRCIEAACARLRNRAVVENLRFEDALRRARTLLALPAPTA